jgi:eukaryotic-like serine/threonine-protein kinase
MLAGSQFETARTDKYVVLRPLAVGGMAELFLARERGAKHPERLVVVKRLHRRLAIDGEFVQMFLNEARIGSTLHHPNVVEVYEIGEDAEQCYIAMEHLHGHDLRDTLVRMAVWDVPVRLEQALAITRSVAAGLHYTHERTGADGQLLGIVHRDVSPHNVFLTYDGSVKVVDFGIAKESRQSSRTRTGTLKGKAAYMAPEHAMGQPLDRRSDVFCIGILLWEMTTGRSLYRRRSELATLKAVTEIDAPRPSRMISDYPRDLEKLVMKTLARSPDHRWATAGELIEAIDEIARRRRYTLGPETISKLMATAFVEELAAWQAAKAAGTSLGDHLVAQGDPPALTDADEDQEMLPLTVLGTPRPRKPALRRRWPVLGVVMATAIAGGVGAKALLGPRAPSPPSPPPPAATARPPESVPPMPTRANPVIGPAVTAPPGRAVDPATTTPKPTVVQDQGQGPRSGGPPPRTLPAGTAAAHLPPARTPPAGQRPANPPATPPSKAAPRAKPPHAPTLEDLDKLPP